MLSLPGYQTTSKIYESANSLVYRARRVEDDRPVVLKALKAHHPTPAELTRYKQEYEIISNLDSAGICKSYQLFNHEGIPVIVLEDFGGDSLKMLLASRTFSLAERIDLAIMMAQNLDEIHRHQVIHKDINPSNIVFNPDQKQLKFIDFGISTRLSRESPTIKNPTVMEGTLAYISPEQTGRMNRSLDYRTDFYSLGVTLYELFTGQKPFLTGDAMELVHCHIARQPVPANEVDASVPRPIASIIARLMAKNAEDRYQSCQGLRHDLEQCREKLDQSGAIADFPLGREDISGVLQIAQKLYGREDDVATLLAGFDRVCGGASEILFIAGYSGVGKTALVREVYGPITRRRGYFISGKYDQFQANIPYSAIVKAFQDLVRQILMESEEELERWRDRLLAAFGQNGQVIIDVIPEVALIVGAQPPVPPVGSVETRNRFNLVFESFIRAFCQPDRPLVIFLDDLQWADSASLEVIKRLMTDTRTRHLLLVGAYRDNEISTAHPLTSTLETLQREGARLGRITLAPLELHHISQLLADSLHSTTEATASLADLILQKTNGNPFFMNVFIQKLYNEGLITYHFEERRWQWDTQQISAKNITDNVVELMIGKIRTLPEAAQQALMLASCIGNTFDLATLAIIHKRSQPRIYAELLPAIRDGLVVPLSELQSADARDLASPLVFLRFKFLHDRVQQAAYASIPEGRTGAIHLQIGRLLLSSLAAEEREERIFDIVNQLDKARDSIDQPDERESLARLNLLAGQKSLLASAFVSAYQYFTTGISLLAGDCWERQYRLAVDLHTGAAEAAWLNMDFDGLERIAGVGLAKIRDLLDKVKVRHYLGHYYVSNVRLREAADAAVQTLAELGEPFPANPGPDDFAAALARTEQLISQVGFENIIDLPDMTDPEKRAAMMTLRTSITPCFFGVPELLGLVLCRFVDLTLKHGIHPISPYGVSTFSALLCAGLGDIERGKQFNELSLALYHRVNDPLYKACVYCFYWGLVRHFYAPVRECIEPLMEGYYSVAENGDNENSLYCLINAFFCAILSGYNLYELENRFEDHIQRAIKSRQNQVLNQLHVWRQVLRNFTGNSEHRAELKGVFFDADKMLPVLQETNNVLTINYVRIGQSMLYYHYEDYQNAYNTTSLVEPDMGRSGGKYFYSDHNFYYSLSMLALYRDAPEETRQRYLAKVESNQKQLAKWASHCEENFGHKHLLVAAELAAVTDQHTEAAALYDRAIDAARKAEHVHNAALACELAAKYWLGRGSTRIARMYMTDAYYSYKVWGADGKAEYLDDRYGGLITKRRSSLLVDTMSTMGVTSTTSSVTSGLDLRTAIKTAQALSREIRLPDLISTLMNNVIENAGAQRGLLFLSSDGQLTLEAECGVGWDEVKVLQSVPIDALSGATEGKFSAGIVKYVARTQESVVLANALKGTFSNDPYVIDRRPKSILCQPIRHQSKLTGVLYLENNLSTGAFTTDRLELLTILSSQVAISIENARLYNHLEDKVRERTRQLEEAHAEIVTLQREALERQMAGGFAHEMRNALAGPRLMLEAVGPDSEDLCGKNIAEARRLLALCESNGASDRALFHSALQGIKDREEKLERVLELTRSATVRAMSVTAMILDYARLGATSAGTDQVSLRAVLEDVVAQIRDDLARNNIALELELAPARDVVGDQGHFFSVFNNLVINARDALIEKGNGEKTMAISLTEKNGSQIVTVTDSGTGIADECKSEIFKPFFSTKPTAGAGLGLNFVSKIVSMYGGCVIVDSKPGVGTRFEVVLPSKSVRGDAGGATA